MSYSCTTNNIHFDKVFVQEVAKSKKEDSLVMVFHYNWS